MSDIRVTRRTALAFAGGAVASTGLGTAAATAQVDEGVVSAEIAAIRTAIGTRFGVTGAEASGSVVLEEVVELSPRARPLFTVAHRHPFAVVFRQVRGGAVPDGTYTFTSDGLSGTMLMVSAFDGEDGARRLEAVFN